MYSLANDDSKTIVLLINDYNPEFGVATEKLETILNRKLHGIVLLDTKIKNKNLHKPISNDRFTEIICDYNKPESIVAALQPIRDKLLVVNASSERNQPYYVKLIPHIPYLNTPSETSIIWSTHKDQMRKMLYSYSKEISPSSTRITGKNLSEEIKQFEFSKYPLISKPVGLAASILVKKADSYSQLVNNVTESFKEIGKIYEKFRGRGEPSLLVEEYMSGDMYSVDAYVDNIGKTWILPPVKVTTAASIGLEGYYSYEIDSDHGLNEKDIEKLNQVASSSIHAVGLRNSAAHIELFSTPEGWKIIELGPRAGGYRQDMYYLSYSIDHALNELLVKINRDPVINNKKIQSSGVLNVYSEKEGIITSIDGFEEAKKLKGIHRLSLYAKEGDKAAFCGNGGNYIVDGVVYGNNKEETKKLINTLRDMIKIVVD